MSEKKYWLENYGCQMNKAEAAALELELQAEGWIKAESEHEADLAIINTCTVRQSAENRIWGRIGHYKHLKKERDMKLVVMGCMAENRKDELTKKGSAVDIVAGTKGQKLLVKKLSGDYTGQEDFLEENRYSFHQSHGSVDSINALVPIMHGCNNFCTYCIVPYVRGREVSRDAEEILGEVKSLVEKGVKDVTFLGQNVNTYIDKEADVNFAGLLRRTARETGVKRIRFLSAHPKDLTDDIIEVMASEDAVCKHLHLPVQHGSSKVLMEMNRRYTKEDYLLLVDKLKKAMPDISLTSDIMVGFPGETPGDLEELKDLMRKVRFSEAFTYFYNPREGTKAFGREDSLPDEIKKARLAEIIALQRDITAGEFDKRIGSTVEVIAEHVSKKSDEEILGRTERNETVLFKGTKDLIGKILTVKITSLKGQTFFGEEVPCPGE
ncbi:tRNA (N6-isopentenyl adenosine(37)-C2)-methylthiotransferase MiaB [Spirochaeta isovalerica]|uniref:tRNA-2-methylthio-N(6)-dimethylallyladenosine synthase n=1 Tax=Spirochaeta isovalerica TaxID=150 RepID=A0A841R717_9SPIO|nr:tRNA (N6-isopentenyl adenosine(37)-C2)-methylthiotransferase MiaB [Spirochaeta isovalerica]MBB6478558.1 tRNA-2-methylthio-N6-dimethylallyladenosine synthase [Spirochaeta isovalerica]